MDVDDTLDWGGNDEDEGAHHQASHPASSAGREPPAAKDEATLSGAESLLALAFGGPSADAQDDKDSDVVSLGGGEDDMQELFEYQSRTHLGGAVAGDTEAGAPQPANSTQERNRPKTPANNNINTAQQHVQPSRHDSADNTRPNSKPNSQGKSHSSDPGRSPSFTRLVPPTGPLALPPKPVTLPPASTLRPSHPSIMSASSMAPNRERERENRDGTKGKSGLHNRASPESDALPLAPGWETRKSRGDSQDIYYYDTKTHQSTWHRSIATGMASNNADGSGSPVYARGRGRDTAKSSDRRSPPDLDMSQPRGTDLGSQTRSRPSRFDQTKPDPNARANSSLTFDERHYRPDDNNRTPPRALPQEGGDFRQQRMSESGPPFRRDLSPTSIPTRPPLPHRDTDRDRPVPRREQDRERAPIDRAPPPHSNGRLVSRNGERNVDRDRSRSPGRGRVPQPGQWRSELSLGRDPPRSPPRERRVPVSMDDSRPFGGGSPPPHRGAPQVTRSGSPGYDERSRYTQPNHDQSSARDRHRSPPQPSERPRKRTRSVSPPFSNPNNPTRPPPSRIQSQLPRNSGPWDDSDTRQHESFYQQNPFGARDRQRLPHPMQDSSAPSLSRPRDVPRNGGVDGGRFPGREHDENDAKRRKILDVSDSAVSRRRLPSNVHDDRDPVDGPKRTPLPPQAERFKEMATTPPPASQPPLPRAPSNGTFPPSVPSGPRRGPPTRDNGPPFPPPNRPSPSGMPNNNDFVDSRGVLTGNDSRNRFRDPKHPSEGVYDDKDRDRGKPRERERGRDSYADLPTGPRAMELDTDVPSRRGRSPPRQLHVERSPPPPPRGGPRQPERWDEPNDVGGPRRQFGESEWGRRDRDREMGSRVGVNYENNRNQPPRESFPPPNSRFGPPHPQHKPTFNPAVYGQNAVPRRPGYPHASPTENYPSPISDPYPARAGIPPGGQKFSGGEWQVKPGYRAGVTNQAEAWKSPQNRRFPGGPNSPQEGTRQLAATDTQRRRSFSSVPNMDRKRSLPQASRASLSPVDRIKPLPMSSQPPRARLQRSHSPMNPSSHLPDRPLLPEEEDTQAIWRQNDTKTRTPVVEIPPDAFSGNPHTEYGVASPPPSRSQSTADDQSGQKTGSPNATEPRTNQDEGRKEGPALPPKPAGERRMDTTQPGGVPTVAGFHIDRTRNTFSGNGPQRRPSPPPRTQRFSKAPEINPGDAEPASRDQAPPPPLSRSGSLLNRLSNPPPPTRGSPTPNLRDRMGLPGGNWKTGLPSSLGLSLSNEGQPSLRDRVEPVNDTRNSGWNPPADNEWNNSGFEDNGGDWRGRQDRRGGKLRKRGRGQ